MLNDLSFKGKIILFILFVSIIPIIAVTVTGTLINNESLTAVLGIFSIILVAVCTNFYANSMTKRMNLLLNIANNISEGNIEIEIDESSEDEIGKVFKSFYKVSSNLRELKVETHNIFSSVSDGNLKLKVNSENFEGIYKDYINDINNIVETMTTPIRISSEYIDRISQGDIPEKITDNYKGDFNEFKNNLNTCIDNITNISKDIEVLVDKTLSGSLEERAVSVKHKGEFGIIVDSVNKTLDVLVGHIDSIPIPVMIIDNKFNVKYMNNAATGIAGVTKKEVLSTKCYQNFKTSHCNTENCACNRAMSQNSKVSAETDAHPQGLDLDIKYVGSPIENKNNEVIGCLEIIVDQTDIKKAERISKKQSIYQNKEVEKIMCNLEKITVGNLDLSTEVSESDDDTKEICENFKKINNSLDKSVLFIKEIVNYMYKISKGDTNISIKTKGLDDEISPAIKKIVDTLNLFIREMDNMSKQHDLGDIDVIVNEDNFEGAYKKMAKGVNDMVNGHITVKKKAMACVAEFANGNFEAKLEKFPGKKAFINDNIEKLRYNVEEFIREMDNMSKQHDLGDIDVVVNEDNFEGAYKKMAKGVNDMVNGHITVKKKAMACVAEFANGNFEVKLEKFPGKKAFINDNIEGLRSNIKEFIKEMNNMSREHDLGDIDVIVNESKFNGSFKEMAKGVNDMVNGHITVKKKAMACIAEFGKGNFDAEIEKFPGKKVFINNVIEALRTNLKDISSEIKMLIVSSEKGELSKRGNVDKFKGDWELIVNGLNGLLDNIIKPVKEASDVLKEMSAGNLQILVSGDYKGDHAEIKDALNFTIDKLNEIMENVSGSAEQVFIGANQLSQSSQVLSEGSTEQASSIEEITSSMEEIAAQTDTNNANASKANIFATNSKDDAVSGNKKMKEMLKSMGEINESSGNISKIIKVIDEIAFQTNILALNAAVEAARAGQHGKGFAVVAEEVRNLAARSAEAAKETTSLIEGSIEKVNLGTEIANDTANALDKIVTGVTKVATIVSDISIASNEQASGISQVNKAITQVSQVVQTNSATAEESASSSEELSSQAEMLKTVVETFKLKKTSSSRYDTHKNNNKIIHGLGSNPAKKINQHPKKSMAISGEINLGDQDFGKY